MGRCPAAGEPLRVQQQRQQRPLPDGCAAESCASSVSTEPIESTSPGSPIAADRLYTKPPGSSGRWAGSGGAEEQPAAAMLHMHWCDGGAGQPLWPGVNVVCGRSVPDGQEAAAAVWVDEDVRAVIEIGAGAHVLYDCGSAAGVFLGHRRVPLQHSVRYDLRDGKMVWFGRSPFWYQILGDDQSPSPPPPWRADSSRHSTAALMLTSELRREVAGGAQLPSRSTGLHREIAGMAISPVPRVAELPPVLTNASPDGSPDRSLPASPTDGIFGFSPVLAHSPHFHSSDDDSGSSALVDTEPMSSAASSPQLLISASPTPPPARTPACSPPIGSPILHVAESPRRPKEDPDTILSPTQPVSPARLPPTTMQQPGSSEPPLGVTQMQGHHTSGSEEPLHLPPAAAFVYAPHQVILLGASNNSSSSAGPKHVPRYPYDDECVDRLLETAVQPTPPTQPDSELFCATAETAMSSDFSQAFLSPPQPQPPSIPPSIPPPLPPQLPRPPNDAGGDEDGQYRPPFRRRRSREAVDNFGLSSDSDTPQPPAARRRAKAEAQPRRASSNARGQQQPPGVLKFAVPPSMSSRLRPLRHAPLALQPSSQIHSPGALSSGTMTPTAVRHSARSAERSSLLLAPAGSSSSSRPSPTASARNDSEFPDDLPFLAMPSTARSAPRTARHRWPPLGTSPVFPPPPPVDRTPLSAAATIRPRSMSPAADTPSRPGLQSAQLPPVLLHHDNSSSGDMDEKPTNSSPVLPQPSHLLLSQSDMGGIFDPTVDPPTSPPETPESRPLPAATPVTAPTPRTRTGLRPSSDNDDDDDNDDDGSDVKPQLITRRSCRPALHRKSTLSAGTAAAVAGDARGWINMDAVRSSASGVRPATATSESDESLARRRQSTPLLSSRKKSLRESLRNLPGNRGLARTGLSSRRPLARKPPPQRAATETPLPPARSPPPPPLAAAVSAPGSRTTPPPADGADGAPPPAKRPTRASHRALDLRRHQPAPRLTRQQSGNGSNGSHSSHPLAMVSGFQGGDRDRLAQQLEARGFGVTENPLAACVCVRQGRLARTLKVLCALARGTPIVTAEFAVRGTAEALAGAQPVPHLVADVVTEGEWGMTLADTLRRARELTADQALLAPFCVYIADDVVLPSPASLAVMVRAAGGAVINDLRRAEELLLGSRRASSLDPAAASDINGDGGPLHSSSSSSSSGSEPDDDSDEDWCMDQNQPPPARRGSSTSLAKPPPTPKLPAAPAPGLDDGMVSEPSLILDGLPESKRRRVGEPGEAAAAGPVLTVLDPRCNRSDLELVLGARKAELRVPARTRLLVVTAAATPALRKLWNKHRALVVDPEQIIQSIVRCALQF